MNKEKSGCGEYFCIRPPLLYLPPQNVGSRLVADKLAIWFPSAIPSVGR